MLYTSQSLTFELNKIHFSVSTPDEQEVMMDWEHPLMSASAAYVTENGGDILEIGFGMGISAGYIQSHSINSHTIVENHPEIIPKAQAWASGKSNVNIVTGSWYDNLNNLTTYDGVFYDTFGDKDSAHFSSSLASLTKPGGVATWWNCMSGSRNFFEIPDVAYQVIEVDPPVNSYFNFKHYSLPKKQF